jgi:CIC family chloride channel protein
LAAAFNAPLAGILFILEEMRPQFRYNLISIKAVFIGVIMASIVFRIFNGESPVIAVGQLSSAPVNTLWLYLVLGMLFGLVGVLFNRLVFLFQDGFQHIYAGRTGRTLLIGGCIGGGCGILALLYAPGAGGGFELIPDAAHGGYTFYALIVMFLVRLLTTLLCFCSGAPGGFSRQCWLWALCWVPPTVLAWRIYFRPMGLKLVRLRLPEWGHSLLRPFVLR